MPVNVKAFRQCALYNFVYKQQTSCVNSGYVIRMETKKWSNCGREVFRL